MPASTVSPSAAYRTCGNSRFTLVEKDFMVKYLIKLGVDLNARDRKGTTPLFIAALKSQEPTCDALVKGGSLIKIQNTQGDTPLHFAVRINRESSAKFLLDNGADLYVLNNSLITPMKSTRKG